MAKGVGAAALIAAVVIGVGISTPGFAKHDHGAGFSGGQYSGWNGGRSGGSYPPGWSHGNKRGWANRGMPPGLYKRYYRNDNRSYSNYSGYSGGGYPGYY